MTDSEPKGGRPKNVNVRELADALTPVLERLAALENPTSRNGDVKHAPIGRGAFFMHLMTGMAIHMGNQAFAADFLQSMKNNADDFWEAYVQLATGAFEAESTTREMLGETQNRLRDVEQEKQALTDRVRELEGEQLALLGQVGEHEEALDA